MRIREVNESNKREGGKKRKIKCKGDEEKSNKRRGERKKDDVLIRFVSVH